MDAVSRSITIDLFLPEEAAGKLSAIRASIDRYRAGCRQLFAVFGLAQAAGAELIERADGGIQLKPSNDAAKLTLACALGSARVEKGEKIKGQGQAYVVSVGVDPGYEMRDYFLQQLYPGAMSVVWDAAKRQVWNRWKAKDPEFTRAGRGWLVLQGARGVAECRNIGIDLPIATGRPKLEKHTVTLKWDREIGAVEFRVGKLSPARWWAWRNVVDGTYDPGTVTLNERDGKLRLNVSYSLSTQKAATDPERCLHVEFIQDAAGKWNLVIMGPDEVDMVPLTNTIDVLTQLKVLRDKWEDRRKCAGAKTRRWGNRPEFVAVQSRLDPVTHRRERFTSNQNHGFSRRICSRAIAWRCGTVTVSPPEDKLLGGHVWPWDQLVTYITYKLTERGIVLGATP